MLLIRIEECEILLIYKKENMEDCLIKKGKTWKIA